ncbi:calcium-binding and coiled-coil domain-containing protein 1b [Cololabis saira]|uniref:calcium-binding and coiled-coil domain-containing protein 1b n=1 Tax=Cololabis saira TaxID=129043 RepID=UPI002AD4F6E6|nr:calcium-binding and coiled-coil domain-containing protein 1b [Cololabis saira]
MDKQSTVVFRNVGQVYFPQIRVECHYSLTSAHRWSSSDWIGIFEMGWSSIKQYYTYTWALVPEGYSEGTSVNTCALFHASYLPRPNAAEYQFVYVNKMGKVSARSRPFTFCSPKPLEELETLREEKDEEDGEEELLLVVPRAQLLQSRLEECLRKQANLQRAWDAAEKGLENEKAISKTARMDWEMEREAMKEEIVELRDNLRHGREMLKKMEEKHKDVKYGQEGLASELKNLVAEKEENQQQITDLEGKIKILAEKEMAANTELERVKERAKKTSNQMRHDEEKKRSLQAEVDASAADVGVLQERLEAGDHVAESLRRELREMGSRQNQTHNELHQARLQVAQLTVQLSEEDLVLREERANSALERDAYKHAAEIDKKKLQELSCELQKKEEWLQEERVERDNLEAELGRQKVLLIDAEQELQELRASLKKVQKDREEEQVEKQDLVSYVRHLEQRMGIEPETKWSSLVPSCTSPDSSSVRDEDASSASSDRVQTPTESPREGDEPPTDTQILQLLLLNQDERRHRSETRDDGRRQLNLPELVNPILSELADSPMW